MRKHSTLHTTGWTNPTFRAAIARELGEPRKIETQLADDMKVPFRLVRKQRDIDTDYVTYVFTYGEENAPKEIAIEGGQTSLAQIKIEFGKRGVPVQTLTGAALIQVLEKQVATEQITRRLGWLPSKQTFITAHAALGESTGVRFIPSSGTANVVGKQMGTLDAYLSGLTEPLKASHRLTYAYSIGLAPPLCSYLGIDGLNRTGFAGGRLV